MNKFLFFFIFIISHKLFAYEYGIDRLSEVNIKKLLINKKLGVLAHPGSINKKGQHIVDLLAQNYNLKKIFSPEHGLRTFRDEWIEDGIDPITKLPVISLYKSESRSPRSSDLQGLDAIVVDLQDVGLRYYTYFSTIALLMKVAAPLDIEIIILDRPNILGGKIIEGKTLDKELMGQFIAYHNIPTRHAMTLGELALMINDETKLKSNLKVIKINGWKREKTLFHADRPWIPPSPALLTTKQVGLYSYFGNLEHLDLAVGRGQSNELAFQIFGAPWISATEAKSFVVKLNQLNLNGFKFTYFSWTPSRSKFEGQTCHGFQVHWNQQESPTDEINYHVLNLLFSSFKNKLKPTSYFTASIGSQKIINNLLNSAPWSSYRQEINEFKLKQRPYLLYLLK